jgi:hypothetical protein
MALSLADFGERRFLGTTLLANIDFVVDAVGGGQLYDLRHATDVEEVAEATRQIVDRIVWALVDDRPLSPSDEQFLVRLGARRAEQHIPLAGVTAAFQRATSAGLDLMKRAAMDWPERDAAMDAVVVMADGLFHLVQAATTLVRDGYEGWVRGAATGRAREDVAMVENLFEGVFRDAQEVVERGRSVGHRLTDRCLLFVVVPRHPSSATELRDELLALEAHVARGLVVGLSKSTPVAHVPGIVPISGDAELHDARTTLDDWARAADVLMFTEPITDLALLPSVYEGVRQELPIAVAVARDTGTVERGGELRIARLLQSIPPEHAEAFVRLTLGGVLAQRPTTAERLLGTLRSALAWRGSIKDLADNLVLSQSGLRTRLDRVRRLTSRHHNRDRFELALALMLFSVYRDRLPPLGDPCWLGTD